MEGFDNFLSAVLGGVCTFLLEKIVNQRWLKPYRDYKKLKGKIVFALVYYAEFLANPADYKVLSEEEIDRRNDVSDKLRILSSKLYETAESRSWYSFGIPKKEILYQVAKHLMGLSNGLYSKDPCNDHNWDRVKNIKRILKITT